MKIYSYSCPRCTASLNVSPKSKEVRCEYCGQHFLLDGLKPDKKKFEVSAPDPRIKAAMVCTGILAIVFLFMMAPYLTIASCIATLTLGIIVFNKKDAFGLFGILIGGLLLLAITYGIFIAFGSIGTSPTLVFDEQKLKNKDNFTTIGEDEIVKVLENTPGINEVAAVNSSNDVNGLLKEKDGYTAAVYFSEETITPEKIGYDKVIEGGNDLGGCIEIFRNEKDAKKRVKHLERFGFLGVGGHGCIGNVVIRTTNVLTPLKQQELADQIVKLIDEKSP